MRRRLQCKPLWCLSIMSQKRQGSVVDAGWQASMLAWEPDSGGFSGRPPPVLTTNFVSGKSTLGLLLEQKVTVHPQLPIMNWILSSLLNHKIGCAQQHWPVKRKRCVKKKTKALGLSGTRGVSAQHASSVLRLLPSLTVLTARRVSYLWLSNGRRKNPGLIYGCICRHNGMN